MKTFGKKVNEFVQAYTIVIILAIMIIFLSFNSDSFLTVGNFLNLFLQANLYGIMALGVGVLMINGYFDLSVGMIMSLSANLVIMMSGINIWLGIVISLVSGVLCGLINSICVTKLKLNSLVATLVAEVGLHGVIFLITGADSHIGKSNGFKIFGSVAIYKISILTWIWLVLCIVIAFMLKYTKHGRDTYAIGGNEATARNSGIKVESIIMKNYMLCGFLAALAGLLQAARLNSASPGLGWPNVSMDVLTCAVLGGVKMKGGKGKVLHMVLGVLAITMIQNGINMLNLLSYWKTLAMGLILMFIIVSDKIFSKDAY